MMKDPTIFVRHMLESIFRIEDYIAGIDRRIFLEQKGIQDSVIRRLEVLGEAAKNLPEDVRAAHPEVPWKKIVGMRDILIHGYFGVDLNLVWKVATEELAALRTHLEQMLKDLL